MQIFNPICAIGSFGDEYIDGLVQDCSNSIANALELLQSCTNPSVCFGISQWNILSTAEYKRFGIKTLAGITGYKWV